MRATGTLDTSCHLPASLGSSVFVCKEANARSPSYWWPLVGKFLPSLHVKPREHRSKTPTSWVQWEALHLVLARSSVRGETWASGRPVN